MFQEERPVWYAIHCNLLSKDGKDMKAEEDTEHDNRIKLVSEVEYPFDIGADESAA